MCEEIKKKEKELIDEMIDASRFYRSERLDMSIGEIVNLFREKEIIIAPKFQIISQPNS